MDRLNHARTLHDPATGKVWSCRLDGARSEVRQGAPGCERMAARDHDDADAARRWAAKEEWAHLKKGYVLLAPAASFGAPRLHRFVGGGYTGAMAVTASGDGGLFCNRFRETEEIVRVGPDASVASCLALPSGRLVWRAARMAATGAVLLRVDGGVVRWTPQAGTVEELVAHRGNPGFLSVAGTRMACFDGQDALVLDLDDGAELLRVPARAEIYAGHSPQMEGALSGDGPFLALCVRPGEVAVLDAASGRQRTLLRGDFAMVRQLDFLPGNRRLLVMEGYGRWSLRCLDLETGRPDPAWTEIEVEMGAVALSPSRDRLIVARGRTATEHDPRTGAALRAFPLDHVIKRCAMTWIADDAVAVRTDYGCASIYAVA